MKSKTREAVLATNKEKQNSLHSLLVTNTRVTLDDDLRTLIKIGYQTDERWAELYEELQSAPSRVTKMGNRDY